MRRLLVMVTVASVLVPVLALAADHQTTETRSYATVEGSVTVCKVTEEAGAPAGWGGSCFALDGTKSHASVRIDDVTGPPVQGSYSLLAADGSTLSSGEFCDTVEIDLVLQARTLRVYVDGILDGQLGDGCGIGTAGTLTAIFS